MRLQYWLCDAKSGNVRGEVHLAGSAQFTARFGGGTCSASIDLAGLTTLDKRSLDLSALVRLDSMLTAGRTTLLVTRGTGVLGEWIVMGADRQAPGTVVTVKGMEWDGYPALRSLNTNFKYTNTEQLVIARAAWQQAYESFNTGMSIYIPTSGSTGVRVDMDHLSHEAYYSDVLAELIEAEGGFEWRVDIDATFSQGIPTKAVRSIVWGHPVLSRTPTLELVQASPGRAQGNLVAVRGGHDFAKYAQSVYGFGTGEGDKRLWVGLSDPSGTNAGNLNSTKNVSFPGIEKVSTLTRLTKAELERSQDIRTPFTAVAWVENSAAFPWVGGRARLRVDPTHTYPGGLDETVRVGQVDYSPDGADLAQVTFLAI